MSGEAITIVADKDSDVVRFVDAIARLPADLPEWVLIGGVAVVLRVGGTHRATVDIDTLARESNRLVELLVDFGGEQRAAHKLIVPVATQLDVMAVGSVPDPSTVEPSEHVFALAREFAFVTATTESVEVLNARGGPIASASLRVATTAGLIALKSVSLPRRADSNNPAKAHLTRSTSLHSSRRRPPTTLRGTFSVLRCHFAVGSRKHASGSSSTISATPKHGFVRLDKRSIPEHCCSPHTL